MNPSLLLGSLCVAAAAIMFGTLAYASRMAEAAGVGAFAFVFWRGALASAALCGLTALLYAGGRIGLPDVRLLSSRQRIALVAAAVSGAILNVAMFVAFLRTEIAVVLICFYAFPALVTLGALRFYGERLDAPRAAALLLSLGGLVLVLLAPLLQTGRLVLDPIGVALALVAAVCQATFLLVSGRGFRPLQPLHVGSYVILAAAVLALPLALLFGDPRALALPLADPGPLPWLLLGGIVGAALPTTLLLTGMGMIGPSRTAILMTFEPVVGVALAGILLGEQPSPLQIVGGAAVLVAAAILQGGGGRGRRAVPEDTGEYQQVV